MKRKSFLLLLLVLFINGLNVHASTNTFERETLENYGVNKSWTIDERNLDNVLNTKAVDASEKIYDFADILTEEEENELKVKIDSFIENTGMDMVVLTDDFDYQFDNENEDYAADFYDYNDFGMSMENNSGILFFRNANSLDPYYDMYTFGDSQLYFDQRRYDDILDSIYDDISSKNYREGLEDFMNQVEGYISSGKPSSLENYYVDTNGYLQKEPASYHVPWLVCLIISFSVTGIVMAIFIKKNKMVHRVVQASEYLKKDKVNITNRKDIFVTSHITSYQTSSDSGGSGGGFSSHSGSSGGGHSSGGGRHG